MACHLSHLVLTGLSKAFGCPLLAAAAVRVRRRALLADAPPVTSSLAQEVRKDFKALQTEAYPGVPLIYLDSGATSQKPGCVLKALTEYYEHSANVHRGAYALAERGHGGLRACEEQCGGAHWGGEPARAAWKEVVNGWKDLEACER